MSHLKFQPFHSPLNLDQTIRISTIDSPQQSAKNRLIEISNQEVHEIFVDAALIKKQPNKRQIQERRLRRAPPSLIKQQDPIKNEKVRISVVDNFTQSHRAWRKGTEKAAKQPVPPERSTSTSRNSSSFIIFQNGYLNNFNPFECSQGEALNRVQRAKTPRNIVSLMRRRNALNAQENSNLEKEYYQSPITYIRPQYKRNLSPTQRITKSCEIKKDFQSVNPIQKAREDSKEEQMLRGLHSMTSRFRNNKLANYIKMKANSLSRKEARYCIL